MPRKSVKSDSPTVVQKMPLNVYTMMLVIAFICITVACVLLWQELKRWGDGPRWWKVSAQVTPATDLADSFQLDKLAAKIKPFKVT